MARKSHLRVVGAARSEWVGARVPAPFPITDEGEAYYPDISMWLELPSGVVLASRVHGRGRKDGGLASLLEEAMHRPLTGEAREPAAVRVPTRKDAARVLDVLPEGIPVRVAPVPEVARVIKQMADHMAAEGPELGWLTDKSIGRKTLHDYFQATRALYLLAPWRMIDDTRILRVDAAEVGMRGACLSLIGQLGETLGFLLFPTIEDFDDFLGATLEADDHGEPPDDLAAGCICLTYERISELAPDLRRVVAGDQWPMAGPKAFPYLERRGPDGSTLPLEEQDIRFGAALVAALVSFLTRHRDLVAEDADGDDGVAVCESYDFDGLTVTLTFPFVDDELVPADELDDELDADELDWDDEDDDDELDDLEELERELELERTSEPGLDDDALDVDEDLGLDLPPPAPLPKAQAVTPSAAHESRTRRYESWIDEELPALGGLTPRAAATRAKDRRRLEKLLREMESDERRLPTAEQYDFAELRRRLGLKA